MKKYQKPVSKIETTDFISEPVYLYGSSWLQNDCYYAYLTELPKQSTFEDGRYYWVYQIDAHHDAYVGGREHSNHNQYVILTFAQPLDSRISSVVMNGAVCEMTDDHKKVRAQTDYMQNPIDNIGAGNLEVFFNFPADVDLSTANSIVSGIQLSSGDDKVVVNDTPFRIYKN